MPVINENTVNAIVGVFGFYFRIKLLGIETNINSDEKNTRRFEVSHGPSSATIHSDYRRNRLLILFFRMLTRYYTLSSQASL